MAKLRDLTRVIDLYDSYSNITWSYFYRQDYNRYARLYRGITHSDGCVSRLRRITIKDFLQEIRSLSLLKNKNGKQDEAI